MENASPHQYYEAAPLRWRRRALIGLATLLPTVVVACLCVLTSEGFTHCLMWGEECPPYATLWDEAWWAFWGSAAMGVAAAILTSTTGWTRRLGMPLVFLQIGLQCKSAMAIIAMA